MTNPLGFAVVGLGGAGTRYANALSRGEIAGARLAGVCDVSPERGKSFGVPTFRSAQELFASRDLDAVVIATPHLSHCALSEAALAAGLHVLAEKPLGVHKQECEKVLALHAALGPRRPLFGVVHNYRADARFRKLKALVSGGHLGAVHRVIWQATHWFRTDAYYRESSWRGRFATEGGGVLVNQAPHVLDTLVWLFGPVRFVRGDCHFGRFHDTEVEDEVSADIEFATGVRAILVISTGEAPGVHRLEVAADGGRAVLEDDVLLLQRNRELSSHFRRRERGGAPEQLLERCSGPRGFPPGTALLENFVDAIHGRSALLAPAEQALAAVELGNAILWSSLLEKRLELPISGSEFEAVWSELGTRRTARAAGAR